MKKIILFVVIVISCFGSRTFAQCSPDITPPTLVCNPTDLLTNGGFEIGTANNTPGAGANWNVYGNVFSLDFNNPTPQSGQFFIKTFAANSGVFQDAAISGGDELLATGYVLNATFDPMMPGCFGRVKIEFFDAGMGFISVVETSVDHTIPSGVWQKLTVSATAPANATTARFVFAEECTGGGAVMFDSGSLINITAGSAGNLSLNNDPGACGAVVEFADASASDNCPGAITVVQTAGLPSGSLFPIGTTINTFEATDATGNSSTCSFDITVTDTEAPFILCGTPSNLLTNPSFEIGTGFNQAGAGPGWSGFGVPAFGIDANIIPPMQDGQIYMKMFGPSSGIFQDVSISGGDQITGSAYLLNASFDPIIPGCQGFVKLEFLDAANNQISFTESSVDNTLPQNTWTLVTVNGVAPANATTVRFVLAVTCQTGGAVFFDDVSLGNTSVPSGTNPTYPNDPGQCGATINYTVPVGTDNCPGAVTVLTSGLGAGSFFPVGTHIESYLVTDNAGLTATCDLAITVEDTEGPVIVCNPTDLLSNGGFETGTANNTPGAGNNWQVFGNVFSLDFNNPTPQAGQFFIKTFAANSGVFQDAAISGGDELLATGYVLNATFDPMLPGCVGRVKIEFFDAAMAPISDVMAFVDHTIPAGVWQKLTVSATAPANATTARFVFQEECTGGGAVMFDSGSLINITAGSAGNLSLNNDPGACGAVVEFADATSADNCGAPVAQTAGLPSGSLFPIGTTTNTYVATDASGNTSTCSFDITVTDTEAPFIVCGTPSNLLTNSSFEIGTGFNQAGAGPGWSGFGVPAFGIDANIIPPMQDGQIYMKMFGPSSGIFQDVAISGGDQITGSAYLLNASFDPIIPGCQGFVKLEFLDAGNNQISFTESSVDNTLPQNTWTLVTVNGVAPANATTVRFVLAVTCQTGGAVFFDDVSLGNTSVPSGTNPTYPSDPGQCGATVNYPVPVGTDNCPGAVTVLTSGIGAGGFFPVGNNIETYTVTDNAGLTATCDLTITVEDKEGPVLVCNPTDLLSNGGFEIGTANNTPGAGNNWSQFGPVFALESIVAPPQAGDFFIKVFSGNAGVFQDAPVTPGDQLVATGYIANLSFDAMAPGSFGRMKIEFLQIGGAPSTITPVLEVSLDHTIPFDIWQKVSINTTVPADAATARFVFQANMTGGAVFFDSGSLINLTAGSAGNISISNDPGACGAVVEFADASASDNCPGAVTVTQTAGLPGGSSFPIGTTTNTFEATDASGNTSICSFDVTVTDTEAPFILCGTPSNLLTNPSFEIGTGFNQPGTSNWAGFGVPVFGIDANIIPPMQDGQFYLKMFGPSSGIFQDIAISGGDQITGSAHLLNASFDPIIPGCQGFVKLEFLDAANNQISFTESSVDNTLPQNTWTLVTVNGVAPANATKVRFVLAVTCLGGGAVFFDDVSLGNASVPSGTNPTFPNDPGQCGAIVTYPVPVGTDNCPGAATVLTSGIGSGGFFPIGTHIETYTVTDNAGLSATCDLTITVEDNEAPVIECSRSNLLSNASFEIGTSHNAPFVGPDWSFFQFAGGAAFSLDANIIPPMQDGNFYLKIFGGSGILQDVPISGGDQIEASAYLQNASFDPIIPGCRGVVKLEFVDAGGGVISFIEDDVDFTLPQNIWTKVTVNATAPANATTARFVLVSVCLSGGAVFYDDASLINLSSIAGSADITTESDPGVCGAVVNYQTPTFTDNCPGGTIVQAAGLGSGATFPVGTTTEFYIATDATGNTSVCTFDVTVNDIEAPIIDCGSPNLLSNGDFEAGGGQNTYCATDYICFGGVFQLDDAAQGSARSGDRFMKLFGGNTGIFQDIPISGGDPLFAEVYVQNASFDPMLPGCNVFIKFEYFDSNNGFISAIESPKLDHTIPSDVWVPLTFSHTAPANAVKVRAIAFLQCNAGGATMIDDFRLNNLNNPSTTPYTLSLDPVTGSATLLGTDLGLTATDNCGVVSYDVSKSVFTCVDFLTNPNQVTLTVSDAAGNTASCVVDVIVDPNPNPGLDGTVDVCETGAPISLFNFLNGTPDQVGVWSGPSAPTGGPAGIYDPATMTPGIYTHSVFSTAPGCSCFKAIVIVTETPAPDAGTSTNIDVCGNDAPTSLFDNLGGIPETGGVWSGPDALGNGDRGMFDPATATPGVYTYTLNSPGCAPEMATVTVNILMEPMIPSVADIIACDGDPTDIVPTPLAGMSFNFYDADPTAGGANLLAGPSASYDSGTQVGNTTSVWVTTDNGNCESDPIKVDVTVNALPNAMAGSNSPLFVGMTMNLTASGGTSYAWTGPNGFSSTMQNPSKANVVLADCGVFSMTATDQNGCSKTVTIAVLAIPAHLRSQVSPSMILEGPYESTTGLMRDDLRTQQLIPLTEPYTALGFTHTGGGERMSPATLAVTGSNAIVDWVLVELRDANNPQTLVGTRAALLQRDGDVVDTDGVSPVAFPNISIPSGNYHISVRHRNHFGAMMLSTLSVSPANPAVADFSNVNTSTWGTGATMPLNGSAVLLSGNTLKDGLLKYSGPQNDRAPILQAIGGLDPTQVISGYHKEDVNLDGTVKYSGPVNDRAPILSNVGGIDPTAIKIEQLP